MSGTRGGNHICYVADRESVSAEFLGAFVRRGVARGQRVLWMVDRAGEGALARMAGEQAVGGDGAVLGGTGVRFAEDVYLAGGRFDADRMLDRYRAEVIASRRGGHTGLRVVADTSWLVERPDQFDRFVDYEHRVNDLFSDGSFAAVCHYDPRRVPAEWLEAVAGAHPLHAGAGTAELRAGPCSITPTADGLGIVGEVDRTNAGVLPSLVVEFAPDGRDVHLDLTRLRFIDVGGSRALVHAARALGGDRRLVLHGGPRSLRTVFETSGWDRPRELELVAEPGDETR